MTKTYTVTLQTTIDVEPMHGRPEEAARRGLQQLVDDPISHVQVTAPDGVTYTFEIDNLNGRATMLGMEMAK